MRSIQTPEGLFIYDRESGLCLHAPDVRSKVWLKPLYAQVAVTSRCNLRCWWCYASSSAEGEELPIEDLKGLIAFFDRWGILGVAFGGGEPFLHPHLTELVRWTWLNTGLDVSITTNGTVASEGQIEAIEGFAGEVRVSVRAFEDCSLLRKFVGRKFDLGVNLLLFRNGVPLMRRIIAECLNMGVSDFLINDFRAVGRGALHGGCEPTREDLDGLAELIEGFRGRAAFKASSRLAAKLGGRFQPVPFSGESVGRTIAVTVDRKVKPTSLSDEAYAFEDPSEIPEIYKYLTRKRRNTE